MASDVVVQGVVMDALLPLIGVVFALGAAYAIYGRLRQLKSLPDRTANLFGTVRQRRDDKAAGKPVAPISWLAVVGLIVMIGGLIYARAADGVTGLIVVVAGFVALLVGLAVQRKLSNSGQASGPPPVAWQSPSGRSEPPQDRQRSQAPLPNPADVGSVFGENQPHAIAGPGTKPVWPLVVVAVLSLPMAFLANGIEYYLSSSWFVLQLVLWVLKLVLAIPVPVAAIWLAIERSRANAKSRAGYP